MKNFLLGFILGAVLATALSYMAVLPKIRPVEPPKPQRDTLILRDTISVSKPIYLREYIVDTLRVPVRDTIHTKDTLFVELEKTARVYEDSTYRAVVSGIYPSLDYIETYNTTRVITQTEYVKKPAHWGLGVQAGYGLSTQGAVPYVGVGISYNILTW